MGRTDFGANPWGKEGSGEYHRIRTGVRWGEEADEPWSASYRGRTDSHLYDTRQVRLVASANGNFNQLYLGRTE